MDLSGLDSRQGDLTEVAGGEKKEMHGLEEAWTGLALQETRRNAGESRRQTGVSCRAGELGCRQVKPEVAKDSMTGPGCRAAPGSAPPFLSGAAAILFQLDTRLPNKRRRLAAFLTFRCGQVTNFWLMGCEQK